MSRRIPTRSGLLLVVALLLAALAGPARAQQELLPTVRITLPVLAADGPKSVAPTVTFGYEGADPDAPDGLPARVRFFFTEARTPGGVDILTRADYEAHDFAKNTTEEVRDGFRVVLLV